MTLVDARYTLCRTQGTKVISSMYVSRPCFVTEFS